VLSGEVFGFVISPFEGLVWNWVVRLRTHSYNIILFQHSEMRIVFLCVCSCQLFMTLSDQPCVLAVRLIRF